METQLYDGQISLVLILTGLSLFFILLGFILIKFPPKEINSFYGYRTSQSMSSKIKWHLAQEYSAKWFIGTGIFLTLFLGISYFINLNPLVLSITYVSMMIVFIVLQIIFTERELKTLD